MSPFSFIQSSLLQQTEFVMRTSRKWKKYFLPQQNIHHKHQAEAGEECVGGAAFVIVVGFGVSFLIGTCNAMQVRGELINEIETKRTANAAR